MHSFPCSSPAAGPGPTAPAQAALPTPEPTGTGSFGGSPAPAPPYFCLLTPSRCRGAGRGHGAPALQVPSRIHRALPQGRARTPGLGGQGQGPPLPSGEAKQTPGLQLGGEQQGPHPTLLPTQPPAAAHGFWGPFGGAPVPAFWETVAPGGNQSGGDDPPPHTHTLTCAPHPHPLGTSTQAAARADGAAGTGSG